MDGTKNVKFNQNILKLLKYSAPAIRSDSETVTSDLAGIWHLKSSEET